MIYIYDIFYILLISFSNNKIETPLTCRISFLLSSVIYNSQYFFNKNFKLIDNFPESDLLIDDNLKEKYIISIALITLSIINKSHILNTEIIDEYIKLNNEYIIHDELMNEIEIVINKYMDYRYNDGWNKEYNLDELYNKELRILLNVNQDFNMFPYKYNWTPIEGKLPIGGTYGNIFPPIDIDNNIYTFSKNYYENINLESETLYLFQKSLILNETEKCISEFYENTNINPPMTWIFYIIFILKNKKDISFDEVLNYFFILILNLFVTSLIVWKVKYDINEARPIQLIRMIKNIEIDYYYGKSSSSIWKPYINTPSFPDIMSGHSTFSSVASFVFRNLFGNELNDNLIIDKQNAILISPLLKNCKDEYINFNNIIIQKGTMLYYNNILTTDIILNYKTWADIASDCSLSRFYGGIHYYSSNNLGLIVGKLIYDMVMKELVL